MNSEPNRKISFARKSSIWCRKRTNTEQRLMFVTVFGVVIIVILLVIIGITLDHTKQKGLVCSTPNCIHTASTILKNMDQSTKPCDDFYQFVCGNYLKTTPIPEHKTTISTFIETIELVLEQLKSIVQEPRDTKAPKQYHLLSKVYNLCMNVTAREEDGLKTIKTILRELGGWPVLEGQYWNEANFDWKENAYIYRKIGFYSNYFISLYVYTDFKNSSKRIITLDQPPLLLSREFLIEGLKEKYVKAYYDFSVDIAVIFGANRDTALKDMKDVLDFEINLAKITLPKEKLRNATALYNPMTIEDLRFNYPSVNWPEYIFKRLDIPDLEIDDNEVLLVATPRVLKDVLQLIAHTPKRVQANYVTKMALWPLLPFLNEDIKKRHLEYNRIILGTTERIPLWKECIYIATGSIHLAAGAMYVRKHFDLDAKRIAEEMVEGIRAELVKILNEIEWMDEETRASALSKVSLMHTHIGFPIELLDDRKVEKFYSSLELDTDNYLKSIKQLDLFFMDYNFKLLRKPVNKTDWLHHSFSTSVNAFYKIRENSMEFPAGILQGLFFNKDRPRYLNYGAIGSIIGHEITHGFDDIGRQYDKDGNLNEWWNKRTKEAFLNKSKCIIEQYGNYTVPEVELNINGINTQGENIADNGGTKQAYLAYQSWVKKYGVEPKLPGLDYTPNQLFWISMANLWCTKNRKEALKVFVTVGYHSNARFRVLGPLSNLEYFANDFKCPVKSKMNPVHKCQVW